MKVYYDLVFGFCLGWGQASEYSTPLSNMHLISWFCSLPFPRITTTLPLYNPPSYMTPGPLA